jgi:hypothetical protein
MNADHTIKNVTEKFWLRNEKPTKEYAWHRIMI